MYYLVAVFKADLRRYYYEKMSKQYGHAIWGGQVHATWLPYKDKCLMDQVWNGFTEDTKSKYRLEWEEV